MSTLKLRDQMARDIFLSNSFDDTFTEEQTLKAWAELDQELPGAVAYAYRIADGLIAKGYRFVWWSA